ncbi:MAG: ribosome biogenesis GTP-binding protein YihA/YsxC [Elusimicrobia bacterium]|nr:ribosome biogenesis GTP-binding protein YihA/YsxC [Elusimicrobiota bacterium]
MKAQDLSKTVFVMSETTHKKLPQSLAEAIFVGRSNVGKSSIINALCRQKNLARTSKTPGRTRTINIYAIVQGRWLSDLPGYGFARGNPKEIALWQAMIEEYITQRKVKKRVYVAIDAFVGPTELDFSMAGWLSDAGVPFKVIANKCDKVPNCNYDKVKEILAQKFNLDVSDIFPVSAKKGIGVDELSKNIVSFFN